MNPKFKVQKKFSDNTSGVLVINKLKSKKIYNKINVKILKKCGSNYEITTKKDYPHYKISKNNIYLVSFKLLKKCEKIYGKNY